MYYNLRACTKKRIKCLSQGVNTVLSTWFKPTTHQSEIKHSIPEPQHSSQITGFPRALEIMENHEKKVLCMEISCNLKKTLNNHGKIMEFCEII